MSVKIEKYLSDFAFLNKVIDKLVSLKPELESNGESHLSYDHLDLSDLCGGGTGNKASSAADMRLVFPVGAKPLFEDLRGQDLYFVGFIGCCRDRIEEWVRDGIWEADRKLVVKLGQRADVMAYISAIRPCGHWANLVLFTRQDFLTYWLNDMSVHSYATRVLAPHFYRRVRIHSGLIEGGLRNERKFVPSKMLYLSYEDNEDEGAGRSKVKSRGNIYWNVEDGCSREITQDRMKEFINDITVDNMHQVFTCIE